MIHAQVATLICIDEESAPPCVAPTDEPLISPPLSPAGPLSLASSFTSIATRENSWTIGVSRQVSCCDPSLCPQLAAQLQQEEQQGEEEEEAEQQQEQLSYEEIEDGRSTTSDLPSASHIGLESPDALGSSSANSSRTTSSSSLMAAEQQHSQGSKQLQQVQVQAVEQRQEPQTARRPVAKAAKAQSFGYIRTGSYLPSWRAPTSAAPPLNSATLAPGMLPRHQPNHLTKREIPPIAEEISKARQPDDLERDEDGNLAPGSFLLHKGGGGALHPGPRLHRHLHLPAHQPGVRGHHRPRAGLWHQRHAVRGGRACL